MAKNLLAALSLTKYHISKDHKRKNQPQKETLTIKKKTCTSCQSISVTPVDPVMLCKNIDYNFEKVR